MKLHKNVAFMASMYIRIVSPGVITYFWAQCITTWSTCQGKPRTTLYTTAGASMFHWCVAYYLGVKLEMKMIGVAIASSLHFLMRFLIAFTIARRDEKLR